MSLPGSMKICQFLPWYSPAKVGGTEIYILQLSKKLVENNQDVLIICPSETAETQNFNVQGIPVIASSHIVGTPTSYKIAIGIEPPENLNKFIELLSRLKPDILHFHCFEPKHTFYLEAAGMLGIKTVITPHLASFTCLRGNLLYKDKTPCDGLVLINRCSECLLHKKANGQKIHKLISFISDSLFAAGINSGYSNKLSRLFSTPYVVRNFLKILKRINKSTDVFITLSPWYKNVLINNGFDKSKISLIAPTPEMDMQVLAQIKIEDDILKIAFVGRQIREKGLDILLRSIDLISSEKIELHLYGRRSDDFDNKIELLLSKGYKIFQYGQVDQMTLQGELKKMDVLCLPSRWMEMAPLVVREAHAAGIPVIGANLGGITDAIKDGVNGFLFENENPYDLASKINSLINTPGLLAELKKASITYRPIKDSSELQIEIYRDLSMMKNPF